jgi:UDPglucose 6-dehydrogenase
MDASKIAALQAGRMPIYEPGLANLLETNVREERLTFSTDLASAVGKAEAVFIAVGTPVVITDKRICVLFMLLGRKSQLQ